MLYWRPLAFNGDRSSNISQSWSSRFPPAVGIRRSDLTVIFPSLTEKANNGSAHINGALNNSAALAKAALIQRTVRMNKRNITASATLVSPAARLLCAPSAVLLHWFYPDAAALQCFSEKHLDFGIDTP
jgi:hypothetical protein